MSIYERSTDGQQFETQRTRAVILDLFGRSAAQLLESGRAVSVEMHREHDLHAYVRLAEDPNRVFHIQAYPGMSTPTGVRVIVREMDYQRLIAIREAMERNGGPSIGNESAAVTRIVCEQTEIPPSTSSLINLIREDI